MSSATEQSFFILLMLDFLDDWETTETCDSTSYFIDTKVTGSVF